MMNDLVFFSFSISIGIFLLGMVVMLPNILFPSKSQVKKDNLRPRKDELAKKDRIEKVESTYRERHESFSA